MIKNTIVHRVVYVDNIRSFVILLVVSMHSAVCYSGLGGWYYIEGAMEKLSTVELVVFALYQSYLQAWFMGMLFFISGYFAAGSFQKRGASGFIKERLFRLGLPLLLYMAVITPFINFVLLGNGISGGSPGIGFVFYLFLDWLGATGPLWFNEALIIFCLFFVLFRRREKPVLPGSPNKSFPGKLRIVLLILCTGIAAFLIRLVFPIGTDIMNLQFCYFASYIVLFALGTKAGEHGWLPQISKTGKIWFILALALGIPLWFIIMIFGGALDGNILISGGLYWQSAAFALWESFVAISFSLGLLWLFFQYVNFENSFTRFAAANSFGVYMLHPPVLIAVSLLLRHWDASAPLKFLVVTPLAIALSFCLSALVRLIPQARVIIR